MSKYLRWELVEESDIGNTYRLVVPGGWLYRHIIYSAHGNSVVMAFVPEPN